MLHKKEDKYSNNYFLSLELVNDCISSFLFKLLFNQFNYFELISLSRFLNKVD